MISFNFFGSTPNSQKVSETSNLTVILLNDSKNVAKTENNETHIICLLKKNNQFSKFFLLEIVTFVWRYVAWHLCEKLACKKINSKYFGLWQ